MDGSRDGAHATTFWGFIVLLLTIIETFGALFQRTFSIPGIGQWAAVGFLEDLFAVGQLLLLANLGTASVTNTTKYLSTLPHPIETLEELISVVAVTANLLTSLSASLKRFPSLAARCNLNSLSLARCARM